MKRWAAILRDVRHAGCQTNRNDEAASGRMNGSGRRRDGDVPRRHSTSRRRRTFKAAYADVQWFPMAWSRAPGPPAQLAAGCARCVRDRPWAGCGAQPYTTLMPAHSGPSAAGRLLLTIFAAAGLPLGLSAFTVVSRTACDNAEREIGIRCVARRRSSTMANSVVAQGMWHAAAGVQLDCRSRSCVPSQAACCSVSPRRPA